MALTKDSVLGTWAVIVGLVLWFLAFSLFAYLAVGDRGSPSWDLGTIPDVPSESPYAVYEKLPHPQHVRGKEGE